MPVEPRRRIVHPLIARRDLSHIYFFFNDTATTEIYTLSLHDALPISAPLPRAVPSISPRAAQCCGSNHAGLKLPIRDPSYSIAPPGSSPCLTSEPSAQRPAKIGRAHV